MSNEISNLFFECIKKLNNKPFKPINLVNRTNSSTIKEENSQIWGYLGVDNILKGGC